MSTDNKATIQKLYWKDVRDAVRKVNPELSDKIDVLDPADNLPLYKVSYPFGCFIEKDGVFQVPLADGRVVPIHHEEVPSTVKKDLIYTSNMPIGLVLNQSLELFLHYQNGDITPRVYMLPGKIFGLWSLMQPTHLSTYGGGDIWQITAGARSLFFLSKISNSMGYQKIKKEFGLKTKMPLGLMDQWPLLVDLANSPNFNAAWRVELIFFSKEWKKLMDKPSQSNYPLIKYFHNYLLDDSEYLREQSISDYVFSLAMTKANLRPNPYLADTFRHIYLISIGGKHCGGTLGFRVASNDRAGPVAQFQKIFDELYELRFSPIMMHPGMLTDDDIEEPAYYSLEIPTIWSYLPKSRKASNKLNDLREIKHIQEIIATYILNDELGMSNTILYQHVKNTHFEYFHSDKDQMKEITSSKVLEKTDRELQKIQKSYKKPFCYSSPFLRGCIRINPKKR